jgi:hypothetical protein
VSEACQLFLVPSWSSNTPFYPSKCCELGSVAWLLPLSLSSTWTHIWILQGVRSASQVHDNFPFSFLVVFVSTLNYFVELGGGWQFVFHPKVGWRAFVKLQYVKVSFPLAIGMSFAQYLGCQFGLIHWMVNIMVLYCVYSHCNLMYSSFAEHFVIPYSNLIANTREQNQRPFYLKKFHKRNEHKRGWLP